MKVVKILVGHFEGFHGVVEGYYYNQAIVSIPFKDKEGNESNDRNETVLFRSKEYEVIND